MEIKIIGEHLEVTPAISEYIKAKFEHLPAPDKLLHVEFRLGQTKENKYVHFFAHIAKTDIIIKENDHDLYKSIDKSIEKIHRSFTSLKEKHKVHLHKAM